MPSKRKDFLKPGNKGKAKAPEPQSEDDFLDAADEFEAAAGKWRAGDVAKAVRFYNRAIDTYTTGLRRYPQSFDLAYNKANLEYTMSEDDRVAGMMGNKVDLLRETLNSHRVAVALDTNNIDASFNTAQVLTSLAEALLEVPPQEAARGPARAFLEEAVDIFTKCMHSQQQDYEQMQEAIAKANASQGDQDLMAHPTSQDCNIDSTAAEETSETGDWAHVIEPVTPQVILETCTAQLGALTTLIGLYDSSELPIVESRAQIGLETINTKLPPLIELFGRTPFPATADEPAAGPTLSIGSSAPTPVESSPKEDALLASANFQSSVAEIAYRNDQKTAIEYAQQVETLFAPLTEEQQQQSGSLVDALSSYADSLMDLASAIADRQLSTGSYSDLDVQWTALTQAQSVLTKITSEKNASTLSASRLADVYVARGDTDLFRFRLSLLEVAKPAWAKSKPVLVGNAGVFFRGARTYAEKAGAVAVYETADAKAVVAEVLKEIAGNTGQQKPHWKGKSAAVVKALESLVEEGISYKRHRRGCVAVLIRMNAWSMDLNMAILIPSFTRDVKSGPVVSNMWRIQGDAWRTKGKVSMEKKYV